MKRAVIGGSWHGVASNPRVANRARLGPSRRNYDLGLRFVRKR